MTKPLGLYIHIPFCKTICVYCAFPAHANKHLQTDQYLEVLKKEFGSRACTEPIDSIYFGGGTPSILDEEKITSLIQTIGTHYQLSENCEISIECNPESLTDSKIKTYRQLGINRLSLGVQSLNDRTLWKVARPHNAEQTISALNLLRANDWENFGVDLIMGLPYQTLDNFKNEVKTLLEFNPTHFSSYFLSYDTNKIETFIKDSPSEEIQIEMYNFLIQKLAQAGFDHYEVSNYAKPGFQCRHNLKYWQQKEYLGFGLGAHSYHNGELSENTRNFDDYIYSKGQPEKYSLSEDETRMDLIMLSLRTKQGLNLKDYSQKHGLIETEKVLQAAQPFLVRNELKLFKNTLIPTEQGYLFADRIYQALI